MWLIVVTQHVDPITRRSVRSRRCSARWLAGRRACRSQTVRLPGLPANCRAAVLGAPRSPRRPVLRALSSQRRRRRARAHVPHLRACAAPVVCPRGVRVLPGTRSGTRCPTLGVAEMRRDACCRSSTSFPPRPRSSTRWPRYRRRPVGLPRRRSGYPGLNVLASAATRPSRATPRSSAGRRGRCPRARRAWRSTCPSRTTRAPVSGRAVAARGRARCQRARRAGEALPGRRRSPTSPGRTCW